ncbi:GH20592 [Drosophila grimshawi]|uniref:GH20592 n=1 Tax=Drosophila grimshawi TaxID=7222 RepID=B4J7X3_DROGR|nr:GH20592 [Drosophila grimshawi]
MMVRVVGMVGGQVIGHRGDWMMRNERCVRNKWSVRNQWGMVDDSWCSHVMRVSDEGGVVAQAKGEATLSLGRGFDILLLLLLGDRCGHDASNASNQQN